MATSAVDSVISVKGIIESIGELDEEVTNDGRAVDILKVEIKDTAENKVMLILKMSNLLFI